VFEADINGWQTGWGVSQDRGLYNTGVQNNVIQTLSDGSN
jgi:hypothetical protein